MMTTQPYAAQQTQPAPLSRWRASPRQNLITLLLGFWLTIGIFVDGWAHNHFGDTIETFFTPWHAAFYSGFLILALWIGWLGRLGLRSGHRGLAAFPNGYEQGAVGVALFLLGGLGDMVWHTFFGIELGIDALFSPTHLLLFVGAELMVLSPLVSCWREPTGRRAPAGMVWPALLSLTAALSFASFMLMDIWALVDLPSASNFQGAKSLVAFTLMTSLMLTAPVLLLLRRWQLPFGAVAVMFLVNTLLMRAMTVGLDNIPLLVVVVVLAGLAADLLIWWLKPSPGRIGTYRSVAILLPLLIWVPFFVGAKQLNLLGASLELWTGICVMAALAGLVLSALIVPPTLPAEAQERA
jgi:hypothetical protein